MTAARAFRVSQNISEKVARNGFAVIDKALGPQTIASLIRDFDGLSESDAVRRKSGRLFGIRDLLTVVPAVKTLADDEVISSLARKIIGADAKLVRGLFFDKTAVANWKVSWHQDLTIAVRERRDVAGFGPWTVKAGIPHVQPPSAILERMIAVRIHLDDTDQSNGALKVIPGSHAFGRLTQKQIQDITAKEQPTLCNVASGGLLIMRPLILHSSSAGSEPKHRRVIHLEFAAGMLPGGLEWQKL